MSNVISKTIFALSFAVVGVAATATAAEQATLAQNEQAAQHAIVQPSPYASRTFVVDRPLTVDTTPATLAVNEAAARRAIVDPPVSRGVQAVARSYGEKATLSQNERAARRAIADDVRDGDAGHTPAPRTRVTKR
jgi:hypothetical protein